MQTDGYIYGSNPVSIIDSKSKIVGLAPLAQLEEVFPGQSGLSVEQFVRPGLHKAASKHKAAPSLSRHLFFF